MKYFVFFISPSRQISEKCLKVSPDRLLQHSLRFTFEYLIVLRFEGTYLQLLTAQLNNYYMYKTDRQIINL